MARNGKKKTQKQKSLPFIQPYAAGICVGATVIYVAVPEERDTRPVRKFATFTEDLHALAHWLIACQIKTVAMESSDLLDRPFQYLESRVWKFSWSTLAMSKGCRTQNRHPGLPVAAIPPQCGIAARILPACGSRLCRSQHLAPSRHPAQERLAPSAAHAKSPHPDEPPAAQRHQRHYRVSGWPLSMPSLSGNASPPNSPACAMGASKPAAKSWPKVW